VDFLQERFSMSERQACTIAGIHRQSYRYKGKRKDDREIVEALQTLAADHTRWGFKKMNAALHRQGATWNHKRIHRVYREMGLNLRVKPRKRLPARKAVKLEQPGKVNASWSVDFMSDSLSNGRKIRVFNVIDDCSREALWIEIGTSFPAERMTRLLDQVASWRGYPERIRSDNGPEFIARHTMRWAVDRGVDWAFIQPGKPSQNGFVERFNRTFREDVLDAYRFDTVLEVQAIADDWMSKYNEARPHEALRFMTPNEYAAVMTS
jgi:putative transposase